MDGCGALLSVAARYVEKDLLGTLYGGRLFSHNFIENRRWVHEVLHYLIPLSNRGLSLLYPFRMPA